MIKEKSFLLQTIEECRMEDFEYLEEEEEELADLLEVIHRLLELKGITFQQLEEIRINKAKEKGSFSANTVLIF